MTTPDAMTEPEPVPDGAPSQIARTLEFLAWVAHEIRSLLTDAVADADVFAALGAQAGTVTRHAEPESSVAHVDGVQVYVITALPDTPAEP